MIRARSAGYCKPAGGSPDNKKITRKMKTCRPVKALLLRAILCRTLLLLPFFCRSFFRRRLGRGLLWFGLPGFRLLCFWLCLFRRSGRLPWSSFAGWSRSGLLLRRRRGLFPRYGRIRSCPGRLRRGGRRGGHGSANGCAFGFAASFFRRL